VLKLNKYKIFEVFAQSVFFTDSVAVPRFLLEHYRSLGITSEELVLILHLLSTPAEMPLEQLALKMGLREDDAEMLLAGLQKKRILKIHEDRGQVSSCYLPKYDLSGLMDQLFEIWGISCYHQMNNSRIPESNGESVRIPDPAKDIDRSMAQLKQTFEQELARPLSHMDCDHLRQWVQAGWSPELITEALRRGSSAGIRTFRYLDSILREWEKKGIRTLEEALEDDNYFQMKRSKRGTDKALPAGKVSPDKLAALREQFDDIYL
jgi:DNA replication protein